MTIAPVVYTVGNEIRHGSHIRYDDANVPTVSEWKSQGTIYDLPDQAKHAAAKLYTAYNVLGVVVKRVNAKFLLTYWIKR